MELTETTSHGTVVPELGAIPLNMNMVEHKTGEPYRVGRAILVCLLLSLLLHLLLACAVMILPHPPQREFGKQRFKEHRVRIVRNQVPPQSRKELSFAKTDVETPQQKPDAPDYRGKRDTRAASAPEAKRLRSEQKAPAMEGEIQEEMNTLEQERQEGPLAFEGLLPSASTPPSTDTATKGEATPPSAPPTDRPQEKADTPTKEQPLLPAESLPAPAGGKDDHPPQQTETKKTLPHSSPRETQNFTRESPLTLEEPLSPSARQARRQPTYFDPSLPANAQPGFRTREQRTRSSGTFIIGSRPALNVAATPRGQYEAEIYRRIARYWYAACDEHRGDIIPGSITISLRLNRNGRLHNMDLIRRRGASVLQQSFTLASIRQASLPAMPPAVQREVVGELLELIFTFNFD